MKVCADSIVFGLQKIGGISTYWDQLLQGLMRQPDVDLRLRHARRQRNTGALARFGTLGGSSSDLLPTSAARYLPISGGGADILHSSYYRVPRPFDRAHLVTTVYDFIYERFVEGLPRRIHSAQKGAAIRRSDIVLCISHSTRTDLLERYPDVDPSRILVTHLSYDRNIFHPAAPEVRDPTLTDTALFIGARNAYKRFDLAIGAVAALKDVRLAIIGPPVQEAERRMLDARLPGRWYDLGRLDNEALRRAYAGCLALLYPSDYEGFGLPLLEAMACGAPVVTNRGSSLGEVGGDAPVYGEAQDEDAYAVALASLRDPAMRAAAVARGFARCEAFSWDRTVAETLDAYRLIG